MPFGVLTVTVSGPPLPGGATTFSDVPTLLLMLALVNVPNVTLVAPVRPVPVMVTVLPPTVPPPGGETLLIVGAALLVNVKWSAGPVGLLPPAVLTITSYVLETVSPAGTTAVR